MCVGGGFKCTVNMYSLIHCNWFQRIRWVNEFGGLTGYSLILDIVWVLGNCGGLKGLVDKVVVDYRK